MGFNIFNIGMKNLYEFSAFQLEIKTTATVKAFTLPLVSGSVYNFPIQWGDGTIDTITTYNGTNCTHTYTEYNKTYIITVVSGSIPKFKFNNVGSKLLVTKLIDIIDLGFTELDFFGCANLTSVTPNLKLLTHLSHFNYMFCGCTSLISVPSNIFDGSPNITVVGAFNRTFASCPNLTSIPEDLFKFQSEITTDAFISTFYLSGLAEIPVNLFRYNTKITSKCFNGTFESCPIITIPDDLFKYNPLTNCGYAFSSTFYGCLSLKNIPQDLFRYNQPSTNSFNFTFMDCTALETLPVGLFKYNTLALSFYCTFSGCTKLIPHSQIFCLIGEETTRFLNKAVNFTECFKRITSTSINGIVPTLWNYSFGTATPIKTRCFNGAGNNSTSISNYADIPTIWK